MIAIAHAKSPGAISAVMVLPDKNHPVEKKKFRNVLKLLSSNPMLEGRLSLHLYVNPAKVTPQHNALINIARLFAPSKRVLLMPYLPMDTNVDIMPNTIDVANTTTTVLMGRIDARNNLKNGTFSFDTLLLVDRDDSRWCPERFVSSSRIQWAECLWTFWLSSLGHLETVDLSYTAKSSPDIKTAPVMVRTFPAQSSAFLSLRNA